jgi:hypothetical protein
MPTPIGVLRSVEAPAYHQQVVQQIEDEVEARGQGRLHDLLYSGELWKVDDEGAVSTVEPSTA